MKPAATNRRISLLAAAFLLLLGAALARAVWIQVIKGPEYAAMALRQHRETVIVPASRGTIGPVSIAIATAVSERGATPYGRPMHHAASSATPSQPKLTKGEKRSRLTSVLAGIDPFRGLKASCASLEPRVISQFLAFSGCGAPTGRVKLSTTSTNEPADPGWLTQPILS